MKGKVCDVRRPDVREINMVVGVGWTFLKRKAWRGDNATCKQENMLRKANK